MKKETRIELVKGATIATVDAFIAVSCPFLMPAWSLSKHMYGAGMQLRIKKVVEWVEMIQDNPNTFTEEILQSEEFQDGFVYALEQYIQERNEEKRRYYRNIFCNFAKAENKKEFEIERFYNTLTILGVWGIEVLKNVDTSTNESYILRGGVVHLDEGLFTLVNAGILVLDTTMRWDSDGKNPRVFTTEYGRQFIKYLTYEK